MALGFYWTTPLSDGGAPILGYKLQEISPGISTILFTPSTFSATISSLTNGTEYAFEIAASNTHGYGPYSPFRTVQTGNKPSAIDTFTYLSTTSNTALSWTPGYDGGATVKWYVLKTYEIYTGQSTIQSLYGTTTTINLYGTTTLYDCLLNAVNDPGYSPTYIYSQSLLRLNASSYSGTGTWSNTSRYGISIDGATVSTGTIAKNVDGNGIVLDGSTVWTFPTPDALSSAYNSFTLHLWYKQTGAPTGSDASILSQEYGPYGYQGGNLVSILYTNTTSILVGANAGFTYVNTGAVTPDTWALYSLTNGNSFIYGYKNGVFAGNYGGAAYTNTSNPMYLGGYQPPGNVVGEVGEIAIYPGIMNAAAIQNYFNYTRGAYGV